MTIFFILVRRSLFNVFDAALFGWFLFYFTYSMFFCFLFLFLYLLWFYLYCCCNCLLSDTNEMKEEEKEKEEKRRSTESATTKAKCDCHTTTARFRMCVKVAADAHTVFTSHLKNAVCIWNNREMKCEKKCQVVSGALNIPLVYDALCVLNRIREIVDVVLLYVAADIEMRTKETQMRQTQITTTIKTNRHACIRALML